MDLAPCPTGTLRRNPCPGLAQSRNTTAPPTFSIAQWGQGQTIAGALVGVCWGAASTAMLAQVSTEFQLFILTVMTVSAATNSSEGYAYTRPSQAFVLLALSPVIVWRLTVGDRMTMSSRQCFWYSSR